VNKDLQFLGIAAKAGKIISGSLSVELGIKKREAYLVIISEDASENTKKKFSDKCSYYKVDYIIYGKMEELGRIIGKSERSVIALTDKGFAKILSDKLRINEKK